MFEPTTPDEQGEMPTPLDAAAETEPMDAQASEAQTPDTPQALTRAELDKLLAARDAQWQARLDEAKREARSQADRARNVALNKAKAFEADYAPALKEMGIELTPEQVTQAKTTIINREFWQPDPEPTSAPTPPTQAKIVSRDEVAQYVQAQGINPNQFPIEKFAGLRSDTPGALEALMAEINAAKTRRTTPNGSGPERQVMQQFANTAAGTKGTPSAGNPERHMENLLNQDPSAYPGGVMAYERRMNALTEQLQKTGKWK